MASRIDWDAAHARLAATNTTFGQGELTDEQREAIFSERAKRLAALPVAGPSTGTGDPLASEILVFTLGDERYAFPSKQVREVRPLADLTPLPGTPAFVAGLLNLRGRIVPVLDLGPLFGLPTIIGGAETVLILAGSRGDVGVLATGQPNVRWVQEHELTGLPAGAATPIQSACAQVVTADLVTLLDAERLLEDERVLVRDEG
jgi:purine-binding chemotaxis protein CheW